MMQVLQAPVVSTGAFLASRSQPSASGAFHKPPTELSEPPNKESYWQCPFLEAATRISEYPHFPTTLFQFCPAAKDSDPSLSTSQLIWQAPVVLTGAFLFLGPIQSTVRIRISSTVDSRRSADSFVRVLVRPIFRNARTRLSALLSRAS